MSSYKASTTSFVSSTSSTQVQVRDQLLWALVKPLRNTYIQRRLFHRRPGQPSDVHRNVTLCGHCAHRTLHVVKCENTCFWASICRDCARRTPKRVVKFGLAGAVGGPDMVVKCEFCFCLVHQIRVKHQKPRLKLRFRNVRCNPFARDAGRISKTWAKLPFWNVRRSRFARNQGWTWQTDVIIRFWSV